MSIHNDTTMPSLDLPATVPGGSSFTRSILTAEEELTAALREVSRAYGISCGWGVRPVDEVCGFELRRVYQSYLLIGGVAYNSRPHATYESALDGALWAALRAKAVCR